MEDFYNIVISPETISGDLFTVNLKGQNVNSTYTGLTVGVYSAMTQVLTSGPGGSSLLTGLTIPILIRQSANDAGYYTPFDGAVLQKDVVANFIFSSTTTTPYTYNVYNTSSEFQKFLDLSSYKINWGDGSPKQIITGYTPNSITHTYPTANKQYTITLEQNNPWGITKVSKTITTPYVEVVPNNPNGEAFFIPAGGNWIDTPISYDYIFSGDAVNEVSAQTSNNFTSVPFTVSGLSTSRISELALYGNPKYQVGVPVIRNGQIWGAISDMNTDYTAYTINLVDYYDYSDGTTIFFMQSSGFTQENLTQEPITKDEVFLKVVDQAQVQTTVFVERGKNSAYERVQRLGEVDNLGDLINYGYGFFNVEKKN
jgi:translation elongation factor P/translation initiation factor 5A